MEQLSKAGAEVRLRGGHAKSNYGTMHRKELIIDDKHVASGSFNYTYPAAGYSYESLTVHLNADSFALECIKQFEQLWNAKSISH